MTKCLTCFLAVLCTLAACAPSQDSGILTDQASSHAQEAAGTERAPISPMEGTWVSVSRDRITQTLHVTHVSDRSIFVVWTNLVYGDDGQVAWAVADLEDETGSRAVIRSFGGGTPLVIEAPDSPDGRLILYAEQNDEMATSYVNIENAPVEAIYSEGARE